MTKRDAAGLPGKRPLALEIQRWWQRHGEGILRVATLLMAIDAGVWLGYEFWRLLFQPGFWGAIDLGVVHNQTQRFFTGVLLYREEHSVLYPPASHILLWPLLGWVDFATARWLLAPLMVSALIALSFLVLRASGADTPAHQAFIALVPFAMYATGATIGNGQLILLILPVLLIGMLLVQRARTWRDDLLAAFLFLIALVKPSISAPFFWIFLFAPKRLRPAGIVIGSYLGLTLSAGFFQPGEPWVLVRDWLIGASARMQQGGYFDLNSSLFALGLQAWNLPLSILILFGLGIWVHRYRERDLWILLGVAAIVARFWTYHGWYDDLLILLPMIALYRIAKRGDPNRRAVLAGVLFVFLIPAMIAPGGLYLFLEPWNIIYRTTQAILWMVTLVFLLDCAPRLGRQSNQE